MGNPTDNVSIISAITDLPASQQAQTLTNGSIFTFAGFLVAQGINKNSLIWIGAAVLFFIAPLLIALRQRLLVFLAPAGKTTPDTTGGTGPSSTLSLLLVVTLAIGASGCQADPTQRLAAADQAYTTAADSLQAAIDGDLITDPTTLQLIRAIKTEVNASLAKAHATTQPADFDFWVRAAEAEVPKLVRLYAEYAASQKAVVKH